MMSNGILYAVYEVSLGGHKVYVAVCINNPYLFVVNKVQEEAVRLIKEKIYADYDQQSKSGNNKLREVKIPDFLPPWV